MDSSTQNDTVSGPHKNSLVYRDYGSTNQLPLNRENPCNINISPYNNARGYDSSMASSSGYQNTHGLSIPNRINRHHNCFDTRNRSFDNNATNDNLFFTPQEIRSLSSNAHAVSDSELASQRVRQKSEKRIKRRNNNHSLDDNMKQTVSDTEQTQKQVCYLLWATVSS